MSWFFQQPFAFECSLCRRYAAVLHSILGAVAEAVGDYVVGLCTSNQVDP
jgi:hypothetical protein